MMKPTHIVLRHLIPIVAIVAVSTACGDVVRDGRSPVLIVIDSLQGTGGGPAGRAGGVLHSDVIVNLTSPDPCTATTPCPTVFSDSGQVTFHLEPKNAALTPTSNNQVTINRYRVTYRRLDGRNTPGVDVPYGFDGAVTGTIPPTQSTTLGFELVRHIAKEESPLVQLIVNPNIILTIADVTFYGSDLVGNAVSATGSLSVEFGNFGDQ